MCAKRVWFYYSTPVWIQSNCSTSDAFAPVILISKTTAGPTYVWDLECFERGDNVVTNAARVWNLRLRTNPEAFIHTMTEVLCELAEDVAVDLWAGFGRVD